MTFNKIYMQNYTTEFEYQFLLIAFLYFVLTLSHVYYTKNIYNIKDYLLYITNPFFIEDIDDFENTNKSNILESKYEDKYLDKIRSIPNEYVFTEEENKIYKELLLNYHDNEGNKDTNETNNIQNTEKKVKDDIISKRLDKLNKSFIMENTPLGNVIMTYNNKKEVFDYYSDNTIPYRYLEPVLRKYVIKNNCRPLYIDMEEEFKEYEEKQKEKERIHNLLEKNEKNYKEKKKNVFAKFKSYNKEGASGHVNKAPPPQNSVSKNLSDETKNCHKIILKDRSNRYSYQGKISNFSILQKVNKKAISKKYSLSFSEYKKNMIL